MTHAARTGPCFICELVRGNPDFKHHIIAEDDEAIIFLSKYPTLRGYALVSPKAHLEDLAQDLSTNQFLDLQARVHRLARALKAVLDAERIYVLSLGSQQANAHLHWHVVPLPRGVPFEHQQYYALMAENGVLQMPDPAMNELAREIGAVYQSLMA